MIINFLPYDLINPEQVKFRIQNAFKLPCGATGENLKWTWRHNDVEIPEGELQFGNRRLGPDGTLTGSFLDSSYNGTYQCFVKDTVSNVETFSRKLKVVVTGERRIRQKSFKSSCVHSDPACEWKRGLSRFCFDTNLTVNADAPPPSYKRLGELRQLNL